MVIVTKKFDVVINNRKGLSLYNKWLYEDALIFFNKSLKDEPNFEYSLINKGLALTALWKYHEALDSYKKVLEISDVIKNNESTNLYFNIWFTYYYAWEFENALKNFNKDLEFYKQNEETLNYVWLCYYYLWEYEKAIDVFKSILWDNNEINKDNSYINNNIWMCLFKLKDYSWAMEKYDISISVEWDIINSYYNKALLNTELWKTDDAISNFEMVLSLYPDFIDAKNKLENLKNN